MIWTSLSRNISESASVNQFTRLELPSELSLVSNLGTNHIERERSRDYEADRLDAGIC